jgi:hypothetical protein
MDAWAGVNEAGFAIVNSLIPGYSDLNGVFMKQALYTCSSVEDFQAFLGDWQQGNLAANFGVIDAYGGAAIFEALSDTGMSTEFHRFDADTSLEGYIVRTNFSMTWGGSSGIERYRRARELFSKAVSGGYMSHEFVLQTAARDITGEAYPGHEQWDTSNAISRYMTRSCSVVHGVEPCENPELTSFWIIPGEPGCGIGVPLWVSTRKIPKALSIPGKIAPLNKKIIEKEMYCYPNNFTSVMNTTKLYLDWDNHNAIQDYTIAAEQTILKKARELCEDFEGFQNHASEYAYSCLVREIAYDWNFPRTQIDMSPMKGCRTTELELGMECMEEGE